MKKITKMKKIFALLALLCFLAAPALATQGPMQTNMWSKGCTTSSGTTLTCTDSLSNQASGNLLMLYMFVRDSTGANAITFNTPTGFTLVDAASSTSCIAANTVGLAVYQFATSSVQSSVTITVTVTNNDVVNGAVLVQEFASYNATPVDQHGISSCFTGSNGATGPAKTPSQANDTLIGITGAYDTASALNGPGMQAQGSVGADASQYTNVLACGGQPGLNCSTSGGFLFVSMWQNFGLTNSQTPGFQAGSSTRTGYVETVLLAPGTKGSFAGSSGGGGSPFGPVGYGPVGYLDSGGTCRVAPLSIN